MEPETSRTNFQSSTLQYLAERVLRAPYMGTDSLLGPREHLLDHHHHRPPSHLPFAHSNGMNESILREMEKQRIRDEIIMEEIVTRRVLEAEVRREMFERDFVMRRGEGSFLFNSSSLMGFDSFVRPRLLGTRSERTRMEEILPLLSVEKRGEVNVSRESSGLESLPFQRAVAETPVLEKAKEKEKIFQQAKPEETICGLKRKAVTPPGEDNSEPPSYVILNKKAKYEWCCSLCQINTTSEQGLKEHVQGKKHKSKEAAHKSQRAGKNYSIGLSTKRATVPEEENTKTGTESLVYKKSDAPETS